MTRGVTTLEQMVFDLRLETRRSTNRNIGQDEYPALVRLLQRTQNNLYWDYDWGFLKVRRDFTLNEWQRYYDFINDLDYERIISVKGNGYGEWMSLTRGIDMDDYNVYDSDEGIESSPARKWDILNTGSGEQMEVFPLPNATGETIRLEGFKKLNPFIADNDVCTLDDTLIVLFAAAELLSGEDDKRSQILAAKANKLYTRLRTGSQRKENNWFFMGGAGDCCSPCGDKYIVLAPTLDISSDGGSSSGSGGGSSGGGSGGGGEDVDYIFDGSEQIYDGAEAIIA